jgi:hypothetical protein
MNLHSGGKQFNRVSTGLKANLLHEFPQFLQENRGTVVYTESHDTPLTIPLFSK